MNHLPSRSGSVPESESDTITGRHQIKYTGRYSTPFAGRANLDFPVSGCSTSNVVNREVDSIQGCSSPCYLELSNDDIRSASHRMSEKPSRVGQLRGTSLPGNSMLSSVFYAFPAGMNLFLFQTTHLNFRLHSCGRLVNFFAIISLDCILNSLPVAAHPPRAWFSSPP